MFPRYLIDSVILIDHLNGSGAATRWLEGLRPGHAAISVVTRAEILAGGEDSDQDALLEFLDRWSCLPITSEIADLAALLRRTHRWKLPDAFQAGLAQYHGMLLATRNVKDFSPDKHRFVEIPYRLN